MTGSRSSALAWWSALTILVSAFLLFQVQPVISKKILPWFGGSPAVWTTCMLFFQVVLLAGYAYAHVLIRYVPARRQGLIHAGLLVLALFTLPITPGEFWKPTDGSLPAWRILLLLGAKVGAPYFLLSSTGPLVQAWFSQLYPGRSPYRLYALSNLGSLGALLTYPFLFEIWVPVDIQGVLWSLGFAFFAVLIGHIAITMWREANKAVNADAIAALEPAAVGVLGPTDPDNPPASVHSAADSVAAATPVAPSGGLRLGWLALAALPSVAFLAITHHLCQDIAVIPPMLLMPLSLYLLSLIICFDSEWWYQRKVWAPLTVLAILALTAVNNGEAVRDELATLSKPTIVEPTVPPKWHSPIADPLRRAMRNNVMPPIARMSRPVWNAIVPTRLTTWYDDNVIAQSVAWLSILFFTCMVCHGELVKSKPHPVYLTGFYLSISAGGALGGLFVALIAPLLFKLHFELALSIMGGFVVAWVALANDGRGTWLKGREVLQWSTAFLVVGGLLVVAKGNIEGVAKETVAIKRNFYGTATVRRMDEEDPYDNGFALYNGRIWHGFQYADPSRRMEPTTYYINSTGAALAVNHHPRAKDGLRVAVIGLGTGTMAVHGKPGDVYRFYDIDPKIVEIARNHFTYLDDSDAKTEVVLGDARIQMEREKATGGSQEYDVIVLDAFSGDAIPAHLLTDEAFALYDYHLRHDDRGEPTGIVVVHISNRYLDLEPVVAAIAKKHGYTARSVHAEEGVGASDTASDWVLVTKNQHFLWNPTVQQLGVELKPDKELLWTDQRTSLLPILKTD